MCPYRSGPCLEETPWGTFQPLEQSGESCGLLGAESKDCAVARMIHKPAIATRDECRNGRRHVDRIVELLEPARELPDPPHTPPQASDRGPRMSGRAVGSHDDTPRQHVRGIAHHGADCP